MEVTNRIIVYLQHLDASITEITVNRVIIAYHQPLHAPIKELLANKIIFALRDRNAVTVEMEVASQIFA